SARASSLKVISEHQHPRRLAPHENSLPQASQMDGPAMPGEIIAASLRRRLVIDLRLRPRPWSRLIFLTGDAKFVSRPFPTLQLPDHENSDAHLAGAHFLFAR